MGWHPSTVTIGDFNGDARQDLAVSNFGSDNVSILLGRGNGTFAAAVNYAVGSGPGSWPRFVAVGDFNGDGQGDLVVANQRSHNLSILLGNGNGTFAAAVNYTAGASPFSVAVDDFNGDGTTDLAVTNYGTSAVSILLGNGNGTFRAAVNYGTGLQPTFIAVGDFNGDGRRDLTVTNTNRNSNSVSILLGSRNGTFAAAVDYGTGSEPPRSIAVGDFNGDGRHDLAIATNFVLIRLGNGDGTFQPVVSYTVPEPAVVAIGNFDGDGKPDLAVSTSVGASILLNTSSCSNSCPIVRPTHYATGSSPSFVAHGDVNGDGKLDLAVAHGGSQNVAILMGNGSGTFTAAVTHATSAFAVAIADLNHDGKADLAVGGNSHVAILMGNGNGTFAPAVNYPAPAIFVAIGDFNSDTRPDLAVAHYSTTKVSILLGNGDGTFATAVPYTTEGPSSIAIGDFNTDGKSDLAVTNRVHDSVAILLGNGNGTFAAAVRYDVGSGPASPMAVTVGDFNGDGKADLATANEYSNDVSILLGNGNGTFAPSAEYPARIGPRSITTADFNGDGTLDLAVAHYGSDGVSILQGHGNGTFTTVIDFGSDGTNPMSVALGDFNRDGRFDLVFANQSTSNVSIVLNTCTGGILPTVPSGLQATAASSTRVSVSWGASTYATLYEVARMSTGGTFHTIATVSTTSYSDSVSPSTAYLYRVRALGPGGVSEYSGPDVATAIAFSDDPIVGGQTTIRRTHLIELREAVNAVSVLAGLGPYSWTEPAITAGETRVRALHLVELRSVLASAFAILGVAAPSFSTSIATGSVVRAADLQDLRRAVR